MSHSASDGGRKDGMISPVDVPQADIIFEDNDEEKLAEEETDADRINVELMY